MQRCYWHKALKLNFLFLIIFTLSSCNAPYAVKAGGKKRIDEVVNVHTLGVFLQVNKFTKGDKIAVSLANLNNNYIFPIMAQRTKDIFNANGVFVKSTLITFDVPPSE